MKVSDQHATFMARAIQVGQRSAAYPFGAVLVHADTGEIVAEAWNESDRNPLLHAELNLIHRYAQDTPDADWSSLVLYTTAEPCPMCQSAIMWSGIGAVYYGTSIPTLKRLGVQQIGLRAEDIASRTPFHHIRLTGGLLEDECDSLFTDAAQALQTDGSVSVESLDHAPLDCPHCGESIEVLVDMSSAHQQYIEDCSVCCRPMMIHIDRDAGGTVSATAESESD